MPLNEVRLDDMDAIRAQVRYKTSQAVREILVLSRPMSTIESQHDPSGQTDWLSRPHSSQIPTAELQF